MKLLYLPSILAPSKIDLWILILSKLILSFYPLPSISLQVNSGRDMDPAAAPPGAARARADWMRHSNEEGATCRWTSLGGDVAGDEPKAAARGHAMASDESDSRQK